MIYRVNQIYKKPKPKIGDKVACKQFPMSFIVNIEDKSDIILYTKCIDGHDQIFYLKKQDKQYLCTIYNDEDLKEFNYDYKTYD